MEKKGYLITDWIFFFNNKNKEDINKILADKSKNKDLLSEFITWKLITVFLPLLTFVIVLFLNLITSYSASNNYFSFINNGSLPIISFGILTSGMPYLLEQLQDYPEYHVVRRRVMSIALFFLFLSATLYILQTLTILQSGFSCFTNWILLILSVYVFLFSNTVGYKMFLLQSKNINEFSTDVNENVTNLQSSVSDID